MINDFLTFFCYPKVQKPPLNLPFSRNSLLLLWLVGQKNTSGVRKKIMWFQCLINGCRRSTEESNRTTSNTSENNRDGKMMGTYWENI